MKTLNPAVIEKITPFMARDILENDNNTNRAIKPATVDQYARAMIQGDWKISESIIAFDDKGNLVNGQHRLAAIVKSKTTQHFFVARGIPHDMVATFDQGRNRTASDTLKFIGLDYPRNFLEWARSIDNYQNGSVTKLSVPELVRKIQDIELALTFVSDYVTRNIKGVTSAPVMAAAVMAYEHISDEVLASFLQQLVTGYDQNGSSNVLISRITRDLITSGGSRSSSDRLLLTHKICALIQGYADNQDIARMPKINPIDQKYFI